MAPPEKSGGDAERKKESFKVYARLKPDHSKAAGEKSNLVVNHRFGQSCIIQARNLEFVLDHVWDGNQNQADVYKIGAKERIGWVLQGYSATIMCYGQTGSGKTHTMFGPDDVMDVHTFASSDKADHGIMPRACAQLFESMANASEESTFVVHVTYVECYNGMIKDLLGTGQRSKNLLLRESSGGLIVEGLSHHMVSSPGEVMHAVMRGNENRVVAAMKMNERSSRGHAVITLHVREVRGEGTERKGKLTLVDLAGMESSKKSYALEGASKAPERQEEVRFINQSLWALGTVIERLSSSSDGAGSGLGHVPYRDSKLTRLLQDSLSGGCKCCFIATLRGEEENLDESIGTLRFAQRAKAIRVVVRTSAKTVDPEKMMQMLLKAQEELAISKRAVAEMEASLARSAAEADAQAAKAKATAAAEKLRYQEERAEQEKRGEQAVGLEKENAALLRQVEALTAELAEEQLELARVRQSSSNIEALKRRLEEQNALMSSQLEAATASMGEMEEALSASQKELEEARTAEAEARAQMEATAKAAAAGGLGGRPPNSPPRLGSRTRRASSIAVRVQGSSESGEMGLGGGYGTGDSPPEGGGAKRRGGGGGRGGGGEAGGSGGDGAEGEEEEEEEEVPSQSPSEAHYYKFVSLANARKLALAAHGYEVENVFVDQLFDDAERRGVPPEDWHEFLRAEFPAPDPELESELGGLADAVSPPQGLRVRVADDHDGTSQQSGADGKERKDIASPPRSASGRMRRVSLVPDAAGAAAAAAAAAAADAHTKHSVNASSASSPTSSILSWARGGSKSQQGGSFQTILEREEALDEQARAWEEELVRRSSGAALEQEGTEREEDHKEAAAKAKAPRRPSRVEVAARAFLTWSDAPKVLLALLALALLAAHRARRLGPAATPFDLLGLGMGDEGDALAEGGGSASEKSLLLTFPHADPGGACKFDWKVGCVESATGVLAQGAACALRAYFLGFRCQPVHSNRELRLRQRLSARIAWGKAAAAAAASVRGECPSHCEEKAICTAQAAQVLHRVSLGLSTNCVFDGTCPLDYDELYSDQATAMSKAKEKAKNNHK